MVVVGLVDPEFIESGDSFKVVFRLETRSDSDDSHEVRVIKLLESRVKISVSDIIAELQVSRNTATNILNRICADGKAVRHGKGRGTYYAIAKEQR